MSTLWEMAQAIRNEQASDGHDQSARSGNHERGGGTVVEASRDQDHDWLSNRSCAVDESAAAAGEPH
ncbi:MAG: hypothetical protein ABI304_02935 [Rudaea sp.]